MLLPLVERLRKISGFAKALTGYIGMLYSLYSLGKVGEEE